MKEFKFENNGFNAEAILAECPTVEDFIASPRFAHHWGHYNEQARARMMTKAYEQALSLMPKKEEPKPAKPARTKPEDE